MGQCEVRVGPAREWRMEVEGGCECIFELVVDVAGPFSARGKEKGTPPVKIEEV